MYLIVYVKLYWLWALKDFVQAGIVVSIGYGPRKS